MGSGYNRPVTRWRNRRGGSGGWQRVVVAVVLIWLVIGAVAAGQRHYYSGSSTNCAKATTIAGTIVAGPLNYLGVNPKLKCLQPSK